MVIHSGGYCFKYGDINKNNDYQIRLTTNCELFHFQKSGCILHVSSQKFLTYNEDSTTVLTSRCQTISSGYKRGRYSTISRNASYFAPYGKKMHPLNNYGAFMFKFTAPHSYQMYEFYLKQGRHLHSILHLQN